MALLLELVRVSGARRAGWRTTGLRLSSVVARNVESVGWRASQRIDGPSHRQRGAGSSGGISGLDFRARRMNGISTGWFNVLSLRTINKIKETLRLRGFGLTHLARVSTVFFVTDHIASCDF